MLALSDRRVQQLREMGMPRISRGKWDLMAVMPWYLEHQEISRSAHHDPSLEAARKKKLAVDTQLAEHKLAQERGQSVTLAEHKAVLSEICADLAGEIESYPVREYTQPDDRNRAATMCTKLRVRLADVVSRSGLGGRKGGRRANTGAAPAEERESVGGRTPDAATA